MLRNMFFALVAVAACLASAKATPIDTVVAAHYAPLMIQGDENRPGYAIDVLREAAKRAGRTTEITFLPYQRAMFRLRTEPATLMAALFYGKQRNDDFKWIAQIQEARLRFATLSESIDDLEAARVLPAIVIEKGTTADVLLKRGGFDNLVHVGTPEASARMLESGRVSAWLQDQAMITRTWQRLGLSGNPVFGAFTHKIPVFLVASPTLPDDVANAYFSAVASMKQDGTLDAMWERYQFPGK